MKESDQFYKACDELTDQIVATANAINTRFGGTSGAVVVTAGDGCDLASSGHRLSKGRAPDNCSCVWLSYIRSRSDAIDAPASSLVVVQQIDGFSQRVRLQDLPVINRVRCANRLGDLIDVIASRKGIQIEAVHACSKYLWQVRRGMGFRP